MMIPILEVYSPQSYSIQFHFVNPYIYYHPSQNTLQKNQEQIQKEQQNKTIQKDVIKQRKSVQTLTIQSQSQKEYIKKQKFCKIQIKSQKRHNSYDDDYLPTYGIDNLQKKCIQNQRRNVIPNLIHQILNFLIRQNKSGNHVNKLLIKLDNPKTSQKRYYSFLKQIKKQTNRYVNLKTFQKMIQPLQILDKQSFPQQEQQIYCSIIRRLIVYYLKSEAKLITLYSQKIKSQNKCFHFEAQRMVLKRFCQ